ncbi:ABC-type transport auxiliary lipoprotein family protein [uncultured Pseudodesulfovibrio sp.]|uniref:ABC-type transport auxiliary lipoprotein family protein n=1 Tax=uncultured Pseudodesulfovibrio sp. TaxID=2035858 RepID=UPI0029C96601|nr:ABC-type transport auxiliary lipoprotein family protein [uncultured Pseudodesulfovibrio sp.]
MKKVQLIIFMLTVALAATACVKLGGKPIDKKFYRISPVRDETATPPASDIVLKVRRMSTSDLYNSRELIYQMADGRIESDFYNMYFVAPGNMLTSELRKWLSASGQFSNIIEPGSMVVPTYTLEGTVNALYGDYSGETPAAVVKLQIFIVDESTAENDIVFSKDYSRREPLAEPDPQALVIAMTKAVQDIYSELEHDLAHAGLKDK